MTDTQSVQNANVPALTAALRDGPYVRDGLSTRKAMRTAADLIEWQERQIERMRAALAEARRVILADRTALVSCFAAPGCEDDMAPEDERALAGYDAVIAVIDEATGENDDR